jgi:signal transduction histidine kinase
MQLYFKRRYLNLCNILLCTIFLILAFNQSLFSQEATKNTLENKIKDYRETKNFQQDTTYINLLYSLGIQYADYNLDSLLIISNESIKLSKSLKYIKGEVQGNIMEGLYYSNIGKQDRAISYFQKALKYAKSIREINLIIESKIKLAAELKYKENYAKALKEYLEAIDISKIYNKDKYLSKCYVNISAIYRVQKEYKQTISFLTKAMEINKKDGDSIHVAKNLNNLAACYIHIEDFNSATKSVNEAISIFEKAKLDSWLSYAYELKGVIYSKKGKFYTALKWLNKSENIHERIDKGRYKIPLYTNLAKTYFQLKNYEVSEQYALKSLEISKSLNILEERDITLNLLYEIGKATENYEKALAYLEELKLVSDTINKNNNITELRILKSNLEFEQEKEKYISENEQQNALQKRYIYFSIVIILVFSIIIFILKRNNKTQNTLNEKLINNTTALKKNEEHLNIANNTKSKLFSIIAHDLKGPINSFKSLFDLFNKSELNQTEFMQFMPQIGENIDSISFTLNNLLSWGQSQMEGLTTTPSFTNISVLVDNNFRLLSKQAQLKSISFLNNVDKKIIAWCDKDQIDVVIRNLISNAAKFTRKDGSIKVKASELPNYWQISIQDNGIGIKPNRIKSLFDTEKMTSSYGTLNEKGTGLGLRVCKEMVENNGGRIWVESTLDIGSTFHFTIPKNTI